MSQSKSEKNLLGKVESVDTGNVVIKVTKDKMLNSIQVNNLLSIQSTKTGESIIGLVVKIMRKSSDKIDSDNPEEIIVENVIKAHLVGTLLDKYGEKSNVFKRTLETVPSLDADCFLIKGDELSNFMKYLSIDDKEGKSLNIGKYAISEDAETYLDGNKFFQRHAVVVGSTGSGKSWTVAKILEKSSQLPSVNGIIFDIHGEYKPLNELDNTILLKVAGPTDTKDNEIMIYLPYWLLSYEEIMAMMLDRSDQNAPNQARALFDLIIKYKQENLEKNGKQDILNNLTIDSPVPYSIDDVLNKLEKKDKEMIPGSGDREKQGPLFGRLTRFIQRLKSKKTDKRLNFLFNNDISLQKYEWLETLVKKLMDFNNEKGNKIIDFSEVPSDILPLITGLVTRLIFSIQQWTDLKKRHPIALFCDEAHLYIPANTETSSVEERGLHNFERVAKEGRKYGVSLVVISQRPADVSKTVLSQCGNFISMRLSNPDDQNVIKRLFPDSLGNFAELLPILDIGESLIVGDACLLPSRVKIDEPKIKPKSATVDFWDEWKKDKKESDKGIKQALEDLRKQSKSKN